MIPPEVEAALPTRAAALRRLDAIEERLESLAKRSEARRSIRRVAWIGPGPSAAGTLRVFVEHSKAWRETGVVGEKRPRAGEVWWELHVEGRLIDDGADAASDETPSAVARRLSSRGSFGNFVDRIEVVMDRRAKPPGPALVWTPPAHAVCDGLTLRRPAMPGKSAYLSLRIFRKSSPRRYKMSAALQKVVKGYRDDMTRDAVLTALSRYADRNNLRNPHDHREIACDDKLRACFGLDSFQFSQLADMISPHLDEPDPVVFDYTVPAGDVPHPRQTHPPKFADVLVDVPLPQRDDALTEPPLAHLTAGRDLELACLVACARAAPRPPPPPDEARSANYEALFRALRRRQPRLPDQGPHQ